MKVKELIEKLSKVNPEDEVVVAIHKGQPTLGGTPSVKITDTRVGFDWDSGEVFLILDEGKVLTDMSRDEYTEHIRYKQLVGGLRGGQDIKHLSDVFVRKDFVIERLKRLINVEELESFEVPDLITDIYEEKL